MLEIRGVTKIYETGGVKRTVLKKVRVNFRESEFVAVLGPSGSGKTTLLNIVGGLDHYNNGDLIINEKSTKKFRDKDWDAYRNHRIGFVFQSYNLIQDLTVRENVETVADISQKPLDIDELLEELGCEAKLYKCDVKSAHEVNNTVNAVLADFGEISFFYDFPVKNTCGYHSCHSIQTQQFHSAFGESLAL